MPRDNKELDSLRVSYNKYDLGIRKQRLKIGLCLAAAFTILFGGLDFIYYPTYTSKLIAVRLVVDFLLIIFFVFAYFDRIKNVKIAGIVWAFFLFIFIDILIFITEGAASPYYAGLNLTVVALSVVMPWSFLETLLVCISLLFFYLVTIIVHKIETGINYDLQILANNIFFILGTSIICVTASYFNSKRSFKEFRLNHELEENNKKLAALDEMKSQFFANVSHEFRTPLTLILGPIQDVLHGSLKIPDKVASILDIIQQNALRLLKLVNDLLDVTKLEEKKFNLKLEKIEVNKMVGGLANSMMHMAISKEIEIVNDVADKELFIAADVDSMEKIILNLLSNSIKFTGNGGVINVSIRTEYYDCIVDKKQNVLRKENVVINIQDNGVGIDEANLPHIFERFKQVDSSSTRKYQGTGLGLALVKELTELQGGKVKVESAPNKGTNFKLIFPAFEDTMLSQESKEEDLEDGTVIPEEDKLSNIHKMTIRARKVINDDEHELEEMVTIFDKNAKTILVADDEPDMRYYIVGILKEEGYNIVQSKNGRTALEMVKKYNPDLIILDLMMPEIDGLSVCDLIRKDDKVKMTKIIMLTARSDETSKIKALQNGVDDFINKPFGSIEIKSRIKNLLQNSELQKEIYEKNLSLNQSLMDLRSAQSKLIQSEKINAIGSLSAGLLHEVNNPLNYTMTALQLIKSYPVINSDADLKDMLKDIEEGMTRIKNIVTDLHAFAYPEEADKKIQFPIREAIESAIRFTASETNDIEKIINIKTEIIVSASKTHIVQVLINLISNAAKAIKKANKKGGVIKVDVTEEDGRIKLSVSDNGIGMDEATVTRVFDPFFTTSEVGKGMGLGLSVSHTIVKNHGGNLNAESVFGEGSKFYFDLAA